MRQNSAPSFAPTSRPLGGKDELRLGMLVRTLPEAVSDARGTFHPRVVARELGDGRWEAWLEFVPVAIDSAATYATPGETHQHTRTAVERWASGITRIYAEGALGRAGPRKRR